MKISNRLLRRSAAMLIGMFALHSAASHAARCEYVIQNEWGNGFVAAVRITNDTSTAINGWSVNWRYTDGTTRTGGWNATISGNNPFTATGVGWNDRINPGNTVEFGVQGNKGVANSPAQRPVVTGAVCSGVTSSSPASSSVVSSSSIRPSSISSSSIIPSSSSSRISTSSSISSTPLLCPQGNSWPDCPPNTWSDAYCALVGPPTCDRNFSSYASSSSSVRPSSSSSVSRSALSCPQGNSWPDCPYETWSDEYCQLLGPGLCPRASSKSSSSVLSSSSSSSSSLRPSSSSSSSSSIPTDTQPIDNPFNGARWYVDPIWSAKARAEVGGDKVARFNTAVWMDRIGAIDPAEGFGLRDHLDAALEQGANLIQVVVYDLPNRDCHALASNGELAQGPNGTVRYRTEYVDALAAIFSDSKYSRLRIIAIIEPDSLPNLVTNLNDPECQLATDATHGYVANTQYTLNKFAPIPNVYSYVDIGHSGWLGWDDNFSKAVTLIGNAIKGTTAGVGSIAGFVSNTSGYTPIYEPFLDSLASSPLPGSGGGTQVRQAKFYEWNPQFSEVSFVQAWRTKMIAAGFPQSIGMLIDTSRNGWGGAGRPTAQSTSTVLDTFVNDSRVDRRLHRGNWCNQPGGIGERPRATPAPGIDAYVWVKPPGESDGAASLELSYDPLDPAKGFDRMCDPTYTFNEGNNTNLGTGALANAPVAGRWFAEGFKLLVRNAYPALEESSSSASSSLVSSSSSSLVIVPSSSAISSSIPSSSIASSSIRSSSSVISSSRSSSSSSIISSSAISSSSSIAISSSSSSVPDVVRTDCPAAPPTTQFGSWAPYNTNDENQKVVKNYRDLMVKMPVFNNGVIPLPYNLHQPAQAAANPQAKYPLVIYLHGGGERGSNEEHLSSRHALPFFASSNSLLTPQNLANKPTYIVAPQCNCEFYSNEWSSGGGAPFSISGSPSRYGKALTDLIEHLAATYQIDRDRIYVTGISMGGGGSWELAARRPDLIAAAVPMSGHPVSSNHAQAVANSKVVIWPQQGDGDENNSVNDTENTVNAIRTAGGCATMNKFPRGNTQELDPGDPPNGNDLLHTVWMRGYLNPQLWDYVFSIKRAHTGVISSSRSSSSARSNVSQLSSVLSSSRSSSSSSIISSSRSSSSVIVVSSSRSSSSIARSSSSSSIADRNLYTARKAQVAPVIDGTVDAVWEQASWAPINVFWLGTQSNPSAADYTGQYKALWDENYLYLLFDVTDDRIYDRTRDPLSNYWEDDTVELFIDENKNGGQHQYNTSAWAYHVSTYGDVVDYTTSGPKLLNDHIDVRLVSMGDKHVWEMRVRIYGENYSDSQANTPLKLTAGKLMGFSASYIDNDGSQQRESMMGSVDTQGHKNNQGYLDASVFGSMRLVE
ncbi:MAG: hypothetical protein B0W54_00375 [Cellvibrio sp. 79]|nr:MAG: hypothetical protein B0W54_00375 [Cellvibrio sp. 79]